MEIYLPQFEAVDKAVIVGSHFPTVRDSQGIEPTAAPEHMAFSGLRKRLYVNPDSQDAAQEGPDSERLRNSARQCTRFWNRKD